MELKLGVGSGASEKQIWHYLQSLGRTSGAKRWGGDAFEYFDVLQ